MNGINILSLETLRIALVVLAILLALWIFKKLIRFALIFLIAGFLIWHFWLS